jgi:type IV pilus assembly protein PilA
MIHWLRERLAKDEAGFTLIELMVVVLIIAILIAIAIPTFLGARERAQDRGAQSNVRNALTAEKVFYVDNEFYADAVALEASGIEPSLTFAAAVNPADAGVIAVNECGTAGAEENVALSSQSASGTVFTAMDVATGAFAGTWYNSGAAASACITTDPTAGGWSSTGW